MKLYFSGLIFELFLFMQFPQLLVDAFCFAFFSRSNVFTSISKGLLIYLQTYRQFACQSHVVSAQETLLRTMLSMYLVPHTLLSHVFNFIGFK